MNASEIVTAVRNAGVVGAGGAGFPTHVKFSSKADVLIVNGAECEPMLHVDRYAMENLAPQMIRGLLYGMKAISASRGVVGIKAKNKHAIAAMEEAIANSGASESLSIHKMENYYPAGDEHNLVNEVTGRVIPEQGLPLALGAVVSNVTTLINVAAAVEQTRPVLTRTVTVAGEVASPGTFEVPVGMAIRDIIAAAGGPTTADPVIVNGGPMMGNIDSLETGVITKTTSGILVFDREHYVIRKKTLPMDRVIKNSRTLCCQCRYCTDLCPRFLLGHRLEPHMVMRSVNYSDASDWVKVAGATLCSECGVCSMYACFMDLSPQMMNKAIKAAMAEKGARPEMKMAPDAPRTYMDTRKVPVSRLVRKIDVARYLDRGKEFLGALKANRVEIPLKQHIGAPALAIVKTGQSVNAGDVIGELPEKGMSARVHASISGKVLAVSSDRIIIG
jgi:Na+-translocating ferredoxin:NAD+ oxidoreductase RnfC subunit